MEGSEVSEREEADKAAADADEIPSLPPVAADAIAPSAPYEQTSSLSRRMSEKMDGGATRALKEKSFRERKRETKV